MTIDTEQLVVRIAHENPGWGYTRIQGALLNLDIKIGRGTIRRILKEHLIEPAPARGRRVPWSVFLKAHWKVIAASDFFTVEVWSWRGLVTHYVLFVIELATRRVVIGGITTNPNETWMLQAARTLTDSESGMLLGKRHLIVDRDTRYSAAFRTFLSREGVEVIRLPPRSPNLNAFAERFVRSVKSECLSKLVPIGARIEHVNSGRQALAQVFGVGQEAHDRGAPHAACPARDDRHLACQSCHFDFALRCHGAVASARGQA